MDVTELLGNNVTLEAVKLSPSKRLVVLSAGGMKTMQEGKSKLNLLVEMDGRQINWLPNNTSLKAFADKYGRESAAWVGKSANLACGVVNGKDAIIAIPI